MAADAKRDFGHHYVDICEDPENIQEFIANDPSTSLKYILKEHIP